MGKSKSTQRLFQLDSQQNIYLVRWHSLFKYFYAWTPLTPVRVPTAREPGNDTSAQMEGSIFQILALAPCWGGEVLLKFTST